MPRSTAPRVRSWRGTLGTYVPGSTPLHRAPAWVTLLGLLAVTVVVTLVRSVWLGGAVTAAAVGLAWWTGTTPPRLVRSLWVVLVGLVPLAALGWWQRGWQHGTEVALDLAAVIVLAVVATSTTPADRLVDGLVRALRPLRRLGVSPERVALAVSLMLRTIPSLLTTMTDVRDAAVARGLERDPRAYLVPFAVRAVGRARATGDALAARGLADA